MPLRTRLILILSAGILAGIVAPTVGIQWGLYESSGLGSWIAAAIQVLGLAIMVLSALSRTKPVENIDSRTGQFVHPDERGIGVVVQLPNGDSVPEDHLGVWFGTSDDTGVPIVYTVPADHLNDAPSPVVQH